MSIKMLEEKRFEQIKVDLPKKVDKDGNIIKEGIDGNYAVISINRPNRLNAITIQTIKNRTRTSFPFLMKRSPC